MLLLFPIFACGFYLIYVSCLIVLVIVVFTDWFSKSLPMWLFSNAASTFKCPFCILLTVSLDDKLYSTSLMFQCCDPESRVPTSRFRRILTDSEATCAVPSPPTNPLLSKTFKSWPTHPSSTNFRRAYYNMLPQSVVLKMKYSYWFRKVSSTKLSWQVCTPLSKKRTQT